MQEKPGKDANVMGTRCCTDVVWEHHIFIKKKTKHWKFVFYLYHPLLS